MIWLSAFREKEGFFHDNPISILLLLLFFCSLLGELKKPQKRKEEECYVSLFHKSNQQENQETDFTQQNWGIFFFFTDPLHPPCTPDIVWWVLKQNEEKLQINSM